MATFDRLLHPEDPKSYNTSQGEGVINGWVPGEITSLDDPEFLGRVKVKVFGFGEADFPNSRDGYAWVGEEFTNAGRPGGSHRMLQVGAQVALLPMMGGARDFLLLSCIPSRKEPPDPELDRNRGLYGVSSPGGVIEIHDDNTQSEIRSFPHGVIQHIDGEKQEGEDYRGTITTETAGGARSQLRADGDVQLETPNASTKLTKDGEVETINASGARCTLEKDGTAKFQNALGSGLTLGQIESTLTGPPNPIAGLMQTVERAFGGNLGRSLQLVRRLERIYEQLNLPNLSDIAIDAIGERLLDILEDLGGGLGSVIAEGMKALQDLDELSIDDLVKVVGPQVENALKLDLGGITGEISNILQGGDPLGNLGRAFSPAIANALGLPKDVVSGIVGSAIAGDGLHFDQVLSGLRGLLAPIVAEDLGLPIESILRDIQRGVDIGDLGDRLKGIIPEGILDHPDIAFPPPELRESLGGLLERAVYSIEEQGKILLDAVVPGGYHAIENLVESGVTGAIADIGKLLATPGIMSEQDIEEEIRKVLPAVHRNVDSATLRDLIHRGGSDEKENSKLALAALDKDYIHKTKESFDRVEDYAKKFKDAKGIASGAMKGYPDRIEEGLEGLSEGLDLSILRDMDFLPEPVVDEAIFEDDPDALTEQTPLTDLLRETWENYDFSGFDAITQEDFIASSQIAALLSVPWASGLPKDEQMRDRLDSILPLIPPHFDTPLESLEPLVLVGPTAPDINKLVQLAFQGISTGDLGEFSQFAGISLDELEEEESIDDEEQDEDSEDDDEDEDEEFEEEVQKYREGDHETKKMRLNLDDSEVEDSDEEDEGSDDDTEEEPSLPTAQDIASQLPYLAYQEIDFNTFMLISQVRGVIEQPWVGGMINEEQLKTRLDRVTAMLPPKFQDVSREDVLEPLIAMAPGLGIQPDQLGQVVLKGITENTLGDFNRFGDEAIDNLRPPKIDFESLDLQKFTKPQKEKKPPKKSAEAFKDVDGVIDEARDEDGEIETDKIDLKALLLSLVSPLIEDFKQVVENALGFFKNIINMIPDLLKGATVRLLPGIGQMVSSELGGGSVIVTELAGALTGPGGISSIVAGLGGISMKFPKGSMDLGEDGGEALSEGKMAFRVAQDKGRSAGVIADPDQGVTLATFSGTSDPKNWEQFKTAEVRVDKGEILLRTHQGSASILLKGSDVYINGRRIRWRDWEDRLARLESIMQAQEDNDSNE